MDDRDFQQVLRSIASSADQRDLTGDWPGEDLEDLASIGAMSWTIPREFGGEELSPLALHERYEQIAAASLATALILTQRDSAVQIIAASQNAALRDGLLPKFVAN